MTKFVKIREGYDDEFIIDIHSIAVVEKMPAIGDTRYPFVEVGFKEGGFTLLGGTPNTDITNRIYTELNKYLFELNDK